MTSSMSPSRPPIPDDAAATIAQPMNGWIVFAALLLTVAGVFDLMWGLAAVLNDEVLTVGGAGGVIVWDFTVWGWVHIVLGAVMLAAALGLYALKTWARTVAIALAAVNAVLQIAVMPAFPLWALLVVALDVLVLYGLTTRWGD
jgi:hypothetical protein